MKKKTPTARVFTLLTAFALICSFVFQNVTINASADEGFDLTKSTVKINGQELTEGITVKNNEPLDISLEWQLSNSSNKQDFQYPLNLNHIQVNENNITGYITEDTVTIGTYKIVNGIVYIHLYEEYAVSQERKIWLNFGGCVIADETEDENESRIPIEIADTSVEVKIEYPESSVAVSKETSGAAYQGSDGKIYQDFAVTVTASGLVKNVTLYDKFGEYLSQVSNLKIENSSAEWQDADDGFELHIGTLNNESKTVTYTLMISDAALSSDFNIKKDSAKITNLICAEYETNKSEQKKTDDKSAHAEITKPSVIKNGTIDGNGIITWTITLRGGTSELPEDVNVIDELDFKSECIDAETADMLGCLILDDFTRQEDGSYTYTYKTKVKQEFLDSSAQVPVENKVTMITGGNEYTYECTDKDKTAVYTEGVGIGVKDCTGITDDNKMKWKITVNVPDKKLGSLKITDEVKTPDEYDGVGMHTIDEGSITVDGNVLTDDIGTIVTRTSDGHGIIGFDLTINDSYIQTVDGNVIIVEYTTTPENSEELINSTKSFGNILKLDYIDTVTYNNIDYEFNGHQEVNPKDFQNKVFSFTNKECDKANEEGSYTSNKTLGWKIKADLHEINYAQGDVITLTDTLPENMIPTDNFSAMLCTYENENADNTVCELDLRFYSYNYENGVITINIPVTEELIELFNSKLENNASNAVIKFHYQTQIDNDSEYLNSNDYNFTNTLDAKYNEKDSKQITVTQELKPSGTVITKRSYYNDSNSSSNNNFGYSPDGKLNAKYLITLNQNKYNLSDSDTIQILDTMGESLQLIPNSIVVTDMETGSVLTAGTDYKFTYDFESNTTTFTVPDERYLRIEYWTTITDPKGAELSDASNTVKIKGFTSEKTQSNAKLNGNVKYSSAGAVSAKPYVNLYKYWTNDGQMTMLGEATFQLTQVSYNYDTGKFEPVAEPIEFSTLDNSVSKLEIAYDKFFELKEIDSPDGFSVNSSPRYFVVKGQDNIEIPEGADVTIYSYGQYVYFENEKYTSLSGTKTWIDDNDSKGIRPDSITVTLYADGQKLDNTPVWSKTGEKWSYTFEELTKYNITKDENGKTVKTLIKYTVEEEEVPYYTSEQNGNNFTNTVEDEKIDIEGTKTWSDRDDALGIRPDSITIILYANGNVLNNTPEWNKSNSGAWTYTFKDLPKYAYSKDENGKVTRTEIEYTTSEKTVPFYESEQNGYSFINSVEDEKTVISGTKTWVDNDNALDIRPEDITVMLYANGNVLNNTPVWEKSGSTWTYTFKNLPKYTYSKDSDGVVTRTEIDYTTTESSVAYYTSQQDGFNFTNTVENFTVDIEGTKTWADDYKTTRPESITVKLLADGNIVENQIPVWENTENNVWNYKFSNLPKYKYQNNSGNITRTEINYTVIEEAVEGYTPTYSEDTFDITNTYVHKTVNVNGTKTWVNDNGSNYRPQTVTLILLADGNAVEGVQPLWTNTDTDVWSYSFENLPERNDEGYIINYTVKEEVPEYYDVSYDGNDITNTLKIIVEISKQDIAGSEELAGAKLEVTDLDGNVIDSWISGDEPHKITGKLNAGESYMLTEITAPDGYYTTETITFTVNADGTVTQVVMKDKQTQAEFSKQDIAGSEELAGAKLKVTDLDGNVIDSWISGDEPHKITGKLNAGESYMLTEITAPDGYYTAETITFTVNPDGTVTKVVMKDKPTEAEFSKQDITNSQELAGAKLEITDLDGNVIDSWISGDEPHKITGKLNAGESYMLTEITAPDGYYTAETITFTVNPDGTVTQVVMQDKPTEAEFSKQDITNSQELAGAKLEITDLDGNVIDSWISGDEPHKVTAKLNPGETYMFTEITAPDGYYTAETITFTANTDGTITKVVMQDKPTEVEFSKQDIAGSEELAGAKLQVTDLNGNIIDSWISGSEPYKITAKLNAGETYRFTEITAPDGYSIAETIEFTVNTDGSITKVTMKDKQTQVQISKQDITGSGELAGAKLEVTDLDGNVIDSWVSGEQPHIITGKLNAGETYRLTEITAPNGYSIAETIEFTVNTDASITKVTMKDKQTQVQISKQDITGSGELAGAKLEVTDLDGNVIDSWVSGEQPHMIIGKLNAGETYRLTEITAPDGYDVAETITFTVNTDDTITRVVMKDKKLDTSSVPDSSHSDSSSSDSSGSTTIKDKQNPNTGITGSACAAAALLLAAVAVISKKKK